MTSPMTIKTLSLLFLAASTLAVPSLALDSASTTRGSQEERDEDDEREEPASLADLPPPVQEAIRRVAGPSPIREVEKVTKAGVSTYEAEYRADGVEHSVKVSAAGEVLEVEKEVPPASLPAEVQAAVLKRLPGGRIREAEAVYVGGAASPTYYEVEVKAGGVKRELRVRPSGEIVEGSR